MSQQSIARFFSTKAPKDSTKVTDTAENTTSTTTPKKRPRSPSPTPDPETCQATKRVAGSERVLNATQPAGSDKSSIPYASLCSLYDKVESESSRLKIVALVADFLKSVLDQSNPDTLTKTVYLLVNRLGPDYEPDLELGLGESLLIRAISECYGRPQSQIKTDFRAEGDLGKVAQASRKQQRAMFKPPPLHINGVYETLFAIAKATGANSQARKISLITKLLTACDALLLEAKFVVRSLEGKLRIGLAEKLILIALAHALVMHQGPEKISMTDAEEVVREAYTRLPNYELLIKAACDHGVADLLAHCTVTPGVPLKPMLAKPTKSIGEVLDRFQDQEFSCEYKYDGERAQVHLLQDGSVKIYSRNSEDMSQRYPDLVSIVKSFLRAQSEKLDSNCSPTMILDCEAVAWDREAEKILPFQVLSTRKRKDVNESDIKVHICLFAFDLLYFDKQPLLTQSLGERRKLMEQQLATIPGKFQFATCKTSSNLDELQQFLDQLVKDSCEGLMVKMVNGHESYYEPSKRSRNWLKLKKDYLEGVGDSLDLVVIGAYYGKGKRTGTYGGFLLASYNDESGEYETTCKIGTGFSEKDLSELHAKLSPTEIETAKPYYIYDSKNPSAQPDVWLAPTAVFEVLTADLSLSPVYKAGHQQYGRGILLRFPRFLRLREDKAIEDATSLSQVMEFYERQLLVDKN